MLEYKSKEYQEEIRELVKHIMEEYGDKPLTQQEYYIIEVEEYDEYSY